MKGRRNGKEPITSFALNKMTKKFEITDSLASHPRSGRSSVADAVATVSYPFCRQKVSFPHFSCWNFSSCDNMGLIQREGEIFLSAKWGMNRKRVLFKNRIRRNKNLLKAVLKRDFPPLSPIEKRLSVLRSHFWKKMIDIFRNGYSNYEQSNAVFHFCLNVFR